jgi:hypothetical protein
MGVLGCRIGRSATGSAAIVNYDAFYAAPGKFGSDHRSGISTADDDGSGRLIFGCHAA